MRSHTVEVCASNMQQAMLLAGPIKLMRVGSARVCRKRARTCVALCHTVCCRCVWVILIG